MRSERIASARLLARLLAAFGLAFGLFGAFGAPMRAAAQTDAAAALAAAQEIAARRDAAQARLRAVEERRRALLERLAAAASPELREEAATLSLLRDDLRRAAAERVQEAALVAAFMDADLDAGVGLVRAAELGADGGLELRHLAGDTPLFDDPEAFEPFARLAGGSPVLALVGARTELGDLTVIFVAEHGLVFADPAALL